ncbi:MAG TPA: glucose-1-phosphate adenylyltransferase subunit GlgD [Clostridiales bacterium]|nr:MAG: Glycogen biosynthesis protein GlgD [Firmicutes bacterium ADurb.Bin262]HOU10301.1 glucose-1-phosphate adenylyltransferase subunit GlgD [Clostridiales bacterium]HQH62454.1 glucose-1-phosphate adenylyltransferase subunit GlgD [Clostridiales bacterium]HQK74464.1 glucose-1-phosphate adenylyltransferase subunit GlgD [Clostridiales bacterium]
MKANSVLGIIYSNAYDTALPELTGLRTMGSVPFAGRYRLIDFPLSNMVNSGISKVGVITKSNYRSLMDHLGAGKPWDLSRKLDGMFILPPFSGAGASGVYQCRIEALYGSLGFIKRCTDEYVVMCDCNVVCNMDLGRLFDAHRASGADITIAYQHGTAPALDDIMTFSFDDGGRINGASVFNGGTEDTDFSLNIFLMRKSLLERLVTEAAGLKMLDFETDVIIRNLGALKIHGFKADGYTRVIDSLQSYYSFSMELLDSGVRAGLFRPEGPVYTKPRDSMPAFYAWGSDAKNCLVASGCVIEGEVENSILFRGAHVSAGASVKNSILLQDTFIGANAKVSCVITDKRAVIRPGRNLSGAENYPFFVGKEIVI